MPTRETVRATSGAGRASSGRQHRRTCGSRRQGCQSERLHSPRVRETPLPPGQYRGAWRYLVEVDTTVVRAEAVVRVANPSDCIALAYEKLHYRLGNIRARSGFERDQRPPTRDSLWGLLPPSLLEQ